MGKRKKTKWGWGDKRRIAKLAGISPQHVSSIIKGHRPCSRGAAERLAAAAAALGYTTSPVDWLAPDLSRNPLFKKGA